MEDVYDPNEPTFPCKICGRKFVRASLVKHEVACKKLQKLGRKTFESGKQRAQGSDIPLAAVRKAQKEKEKFGGIFPRPKTHWRERHQEFIGAVAGARQVDVALKTGAPLPPPPKTSFNPDYVRCDYCGRSFNERAADRHIAFCREQHARTGSHTATAPKAPKTGASKSRSQSQPRTPANRSQSQSRDVSTRRPSTKANVTGSKAPSTAASLKSSQGRHVTNSADVSRVRTSHLPTPVKRSNSAPRNVNTPSPKKPISRSASRNGKPPSTSSSTASAGHKSRL